MILHDGPAVLGFEPWREIDAPHFGGKFPRAIATAMDTGLIARQAGRAAHAAAAWRGDAGRGSLAAAAATSARSVPITRAHCARSGWAVDEVSRAIVDLGGLARFALSILKARVL